MAIGLSASIKPSSETASLMNLPSLALRLIVAASLLAWGPSQADGSFPVDRTAYLWRNGYSACSDPSYDQNPIELGRCGIAYVNGQPISNFDDCSIVFGANTRYANVTCRYIPHGNYLSNGGPVSLQLGPMSGCPANSALSGSTCTCGQGYAPNSVPAANASACFQIAESDKSKKPLSCSKNPGAGDPIYPINGGMKQYVDTGLVVGGLLLNLTYDTSRRSPTGNSAYDFMPMGPAVMGELWTSSLHRSLTTVASDKKIRQYEKVWRNGYSACSDPSYDQNPIDLGRCGIAYVNGQPISNFDSCSISYGSPTSGTVTCRYIPGNNYLSNGGPVVLVDRLANLAENYIVVRAGRGDGHVASFTGNGANAFSQDTDVNDRLVAILGGPPQYTPKSVQGFSYYDKAKGAIETYDVAGALTRVDSTSGRWSQYTYSDSSTTPSIAPGAGYLLTVTDSFGRVVSFTYNAVGLVTQITGPEGQLIAAAYTNGNLSSLTWQDAKVRQFVYENPSFVWALTGVIDERGIRKSTFGYDSGGRATSTEEAAGVNRYSVAYTQPPLLVITDTPDWENTRVRRNRTWQPPQGTTLTDPYNSVSAMGAVSSLGSSIVSSRSQPAGSGCAASTSSLAYDANGNVEVEDDFNANRVCRSHDLGRNLESVRVEGLAPSQTCSTVTASGATLATGSRKLSSQWHPDWRLATKLAEPGRITTSVYNGQPDPFNGNAFASCAPAGALLPDGKPIVVKCKSVEQATTDADGALGFGAALQAGVVNRVQQWTYNQYGQVLTERDPLNNTTTYAYHPTTTADVTMGDLASVTNAKGHVTQYTKYNRHGQLLESSDPNGVATLNTYDLRQRLKITSVGGQSTGYDYDAAGQLTRITQPDASWIGYEYDDAQRRKAVLDNRGNRIDYTLDNAGLRIAEQVKDPGGVRKRQLTRIPDALGRVQQTIGRE